MAIDKSELMSVGKIFEAWTSEASTKQLFIGTEYAKMYILYRYNGIIYRSTVFTRDTHFGVEPRMIRTLHVKLTNADILPKDATAGWSMEDYAQAFRPICDWVTNGIFAISFLFSLV